MLETQAEAKPAAAFTVLDWIGVAVSVAAIGWLVRFPFVTAPAFEKMFKDMGGALPGPTQLALSRPLALSLAGLSALLVAAAILVRGSLLVRRALAVASFLVSAGASAFFLSAMYLPIFNLAGSVK